MLGNEAPTKIEKHDGKVLVDNAGGPETIDQEGARRITAQDAHDMVHVVNVARTPSPDDSCHTPGVVSGACTISSQSARRSRACSIASFLAAICPFRPARPSTVWARNGS